MVFDIYKRGQGKYTRLCSAFAWLIIAGLACWRIYAVLESNDAGDWIETMVPACLFVIFAFLIFWLVNKTGIADFMIAAEGEMKKVSWSSRKEIAVSTFVVIMVVIIMAVLLGVTDLVFQVFFDFRRRMQNIYHPFTIGHHRIVHSVINYRIDIICPFCYLRDVPFIRVVLKSVRDG